MRLFIRSSRDGEELGVEGREINRKDGRTEEEQEVRLKRGRRINTLVLLENMAVCKSIYKAIQ